MKGNTFLDIDKETMVDILNDWWDRRSYGNTDEIITYVEPAVGDTGRFLITIEEKPEKETDNVQD